MYLFSIHQIYSKGNFIFLILSDVHFLYTSVGREDFDVYPMYTSVMNCMEQEHGCILNVYIITQPVNNLPPYLLWCILFVYTSDELYKNRARMYTNCIHHCSTYQ